MSASSRIFSEPMLSIFYIASVRFNMSQLAHTISRADMKMPLGNLFDLAAALYLYGLPHVSWQKCQK